MNVQNINYKNNINFNGAIKLPRRVGKEVIIDFAKQINTTTNLLVGDKNVSFRFNDLDKESEALEYLKRKNIVYMHYNDPLLSVDDFKNFAKD